MDLWYMIKERSPFLSFFLVIILLSIFILVVTWKNRINIPKSVTTMIILTQTIIIIASVIAMIFTISFGYNS